MAKTLFVFGYRAFTSEADVREFAKVAPEEAKKFTYRGETPKCLWHVEGPRVDFITGDMHRAVAELTMWGAGHSLAQITIFDWDAEYERRFGQWIEKSDALDTELLKRYRTSEISGLTTPRNGAAIRPPRCLCRLTDRSWHHATTDRQRD